MNANEMRLKAAEAVSAAVQRGITVLLTTEGPFGVPESIHLGCNTALAALTPIVPFLVSRPNLTKEEAAIQGPGLLVKMINQDTLLLACLIVRRMHQDAQVDPDTTNSNGVGLNQEIHFGPEVLNNAIEDWKKLTGKNPRDVFDPKLLDGIESSMKQASKPFDDFLEQRIKQNKFPSSGTLQ